MQRFETKLAQATDPKSGFMLGAVGLVANRQGDILYHYAAGRQTAAGDSAALDPDSTISWTSAAKFVTNIAALQLVERGLVKMDEPLAKHIPELDRLPLVRKGVDTPFIISKPRVRITLRHVLTHTCGIFMEDDPLVESFMASDYGLELSNLAKQDGGRVHPLLELFCLPLIFEPGERFAYGRSTYVLQYLVQKLSNQRFVEFIQDNIFNPLYMTTATYLPDEVLSTWNRRLQMVEPQGSRLIPVDEHTRGFTCSITDMAKLLTDLISTSSKLLRQDFVKLLFEPQLSVTQQQSLQSDSGNFYFIADVNKYDPPPKVNWTAAGLLYIEEELERSGLPSETVTWEGMGNVLICMNKSLGLSMLFGAQHWLIEGRVNDVACMFLQSSWQAFFRSSPEYIL